MGIDRQLLIRYLRQRAELGESTVFLESLGRREVAGALTRVPAEAPAVPRSAPEPIASGSEREPVATGSVPAKTHAGRASEAAPPLRGPGARANELRVLQQEAAACVRCVLHETRSNVVFGVGNPDADLVVVGEAPGQQEDLRGEPFVGPAGKLLDLLLQSIGLGREDVYICNVLKCRPPQNRNPLPPEIECCSPYLHRQLELIRPSVLLAVGKFAAQTLLATEAPIGRLRGRVHEYRGVPLVATFHPAYLLRSRSQIRAGWSDLQLARRVLDGSAA